MNPIHVIQPLPNLAVLAIVMATLTGLVIGASWFTRRVLGLRPDRARDDAAFDAFKVVFGMAGVVLSFSLVQATNNVQRVEQVIGREAAALSAVDRSLLRFGTAEAAGLRPLLEQYGKGRVSIEWKSLLYGRRSPAVDLLYNNLSRTARAMQPADPRQQTLFAEMLRNLDDLAESRELVIASSETELPNVFWIMSGGLLTIGICVAGLTHPTRQRAVTLGAMAAAISLLFSFVVITDRPFVGENAVQPTAIINIMTLNSRRV